MTGQARIDTGIAGSSSLSHAKHLGGDPTGTTGTTGRRGSRKRTWLRFVEQRRRELHDEYPCATPTHRRRCPKHHVRVGSITRICKPCRDELYEQLAADYHEEEKMSTEETPIVGPMTGDEVIELADAEEKKGELVVHDPTPGLFGTDDPALVVTRASEISTLLARVIREKKLSTSIGGKEHVLVEGWTLLGSMLGVLPYTVWNRPLEDGWEARVEARTLDGRAIAAAEAECLRAERRWAKADDYAVRSMAQTRATSKALRLPLGFVMHLAGFETTPADEAPFAEDPVIAEDAVIAEDEARIPPERQPSRQQKARIGELIAQLAEREPDRDWRKEARQLAGCPADMLTNTIAANLIDRLEQELTTA
jgi:hypothetical protein